MLESAGNRAQSRINQGIPSQIESRPAYTPTRIDSSFRANMLDKMRQTRRSY